MYKYKPVDDKVVIKKLNIENKTDSGIFLSSTQGVLTNTYEIVRLSDDIKKYVRNNLNVGDVIVIRDRTTEFLERVIEDGKIVEYYFASIFIDFSFLKSTDVS